MKRNLVIFALLFVCMAIGAQTVFKNEEVEVSLLKEKTWVFSTWDYTTMYLIVPLLILLPARLFQRSRQGKALLFVNSSTFHKATELRNSMHDLIIFLT